MTPLRVVAVFAVLLILTLWLVHEPDDPPLRVVTKEAPREFTQPVHAWIVPSSTTSVPTTSTTAVARSHPSERRDVFHALAMCETGGTMNPRAYNPAGPYYSFFQFSAETWRALGGTGLPWDHPYPVQKAMAQKAVDRYGWSSQFPACSRKLGVA